MDGIIQKYDFKKGSEKTAEKLEEELSEWTDEKMEDTASKKMALKALEVFLAKVCIPDFPTEESPGCEMAKCAFETISRTIGHLIDENKAKAGDFHQPLLEMIQKLITSGPGTTHLMLIPEVFAVPEVEFEEQYLRTLKGDKLRHVLSWCKREYKNREKIEYEDFRDKVKSGMGRLIEDGFSGDQAKENREEFLDLYIYFKYGFLDRKEEELQLMCDMSDWIDYHLDRDPLNGVKDKAVYLKFLDCIKGIVLGKTFPANDDDMDRAKTGLGHFFDGIKEAGNLKDVHVELMEFASLIFEQKAGKPVHEIIEAIGYYFYHVDESHVKGNGKMFESVCKKVTTIVEGCKDQRLLEVKFVDAIVSEVLVKCMDNSPGHAKLLINLIRILIKIPLKTTLSAAIEALREKERAIKWKEHKDAAQEIFGSISKVQVPARDDEDAREEILDKYKDFTEYFLEQIKKARILQEFNEGLVEFALFILESNNTAMFKLGAEVAEKTEFDAKKNKGLIVGVFRRLTPCLDSDKYDWLEDYDLSNLTTSLVSNAINGVKSGNQLEEEDYRVVVGTARVVMMKDFIRKDGYEAGSVFYQIYTTLVSTLLQKLDDINELGWAEPAYGPMIDLLEHELDNVREMAGMHLDQVCRKGGVYLAGSIDRLIKVFLEHETYALISAITNAYPSNPEPVHREFQKLIKYLDSGDSSVQMFALQLYAAVAKKHPEQFTEANLKAMWKEANTDENSAVQILMAMEDVAKKHPEKFDKLIPSLMDNKKLPSYAQPSIINLLKQIGLRSKKHAEPIIDYYMKTLKGPEEQTLFLCTLDGLRNVGGKNLPILTKHKGDIEAVQKSAQIQYTKDGCTSLIDIIEGRSLAALSEDIKDTQEDVEQLDARVTTTESDVKVVKKDVAKQKKDIKDVKKDVKTQGKKIGQLEVTVDETVAKVEEIDGKTLSHAPFWSRDVSKLLNPKSEHDWRLLSSRLGYSNDDIRGWAQQHDPCMAMLNEWYAVRKTSEASFAVLNALQEMNRMDAGAIVENAMKMADSDMDKLELILEQQQRVTLNIGGQRFLVAVSTLRNSEGSLFYQMTKCTELMQQEEIFIDRDKTVVEDEEFEYASPPAVFISYQWGMQNEVKLLKQHLEMAGYECWMDIGQMGGGDKLFEKIDKGIRGSKVIISCVTEKYAKSPNCNREVNLSVGLGRPIIPLLMEKQTWPPAGSMGPIFSEYLFIRFFTRPGEDTGDQRYWSAAKFQELLMQLNYNGIVPDEAKVKKEYKNWWTPVVEEIKIDKKKKDSGNQSQAKQTELAEVAAVSPDVFISYQWGKQKQIMVLYRRLTGLGYSCWMDIHQMGGGDSLYDKIDRGVRGCKLVLSCVTTKYSLSANCRREVSLADALKKPIVPLLLEKITWPPSGPMSMVLTQLLYINFSKDESVQDRWTGKEFDELVLKIEANVPALESRQESPNVQAIEEKKTRDRDGDKPSTNPQANKKAPHTAQSPQSQSSGPERIKPEQKPEIKEERKVEPQARKPQQSSPEPQKSKSCTLL